MDIWQVDEFLEDLRSSGILVEIISTYPGTCRRLGAELCPKILGSVLRLRYVSKVLREIFGELSGKCWACLVDMFGSFEG